MKIIVFLVLAFISLQSAMAIEEADITFRIIGNSVFTEQNIIFREPSAYAINLPDDAQSVVVEADSKETKNSSVFGKNISVKYTTKEYIDAKSFIADIKFPEEAENLSIQLVLPIDTILEQPVGKSGSSPSVFPRATSVKSDGQHIILSWERKNVSAEEGLPIFVRYRKQQNIAWILVPVILAFFAALGIITKWKKPRIKKQVLHKKEAVPKRKPGLGIEEHLKEDEAQIVSILKQREGQCEQGTLRVVTGFSKAKLSGLLMELEDRKIVYKEKRGKKNLVFLRE